MSGWTIAQLLAIPVDEIVIQEPIEGTVKLFKDVTTHEEYGESQFFVLEDATGEIAVIWAVSNPKDRLDPVQKHDRIRIQATEYKGRLVGAKKQVYTKGNEKKASIKVSGNRLTNLTRPTQAPAAGVQTAPAASSAAGPALPPIPEQEAVDAYWRIFERCAAKLSRFMEVEDFDGFMATAGEDTIDQCHAATREVFRGLLSGRVAPSHQQPAPASKPASRTTTPTEDPFEGITDDDGDIPFVVFLPFLLPLLYFAASGGFA